MKEPQQDLVRCGVVTPSDRPPSAITGFTVEPGGYSPRMARFNSGTSMLSRSAAYSGRLRPRPKGFGSKPGVDTIAMTSPLFGSMATTAPRRPMRPCSATSCVGRSMVVMTSRPGSRLQFLQLGRERALALHRAAGGIHQDLARAVGAVQLRFVGSFDAQLADQRGAGVLAELVVLLELLDVVFADGGHVAERMHGVFAMWIEAREARGDVHAREFEAMHGEARDFLVGEPQADRHALEAAARSDQLGAFRRDRRPAARRSR